MAATTDWGLAALDHQPPPNHNLTEHQGEVWGIHIANPLRPRIRVHVRSNRSPKPVDRLPLILEHHDLDDRLRPFLVDFQLGSQIVDEVPLTHQVA